MLLNAKGGIFLLSYAVMPLFLVSVPFIDPYLLVGRHLVSVKMRLKTQGCDCHQVVYIISMLPRPF